MANHRSAIKAHVQSQKRRARHRHVKSTTATSVKRARQAIAQGQAQPNAGLVQRAVKQLAHAVARGALNKHTASRRTSRLMRQAHRCATRGK